MKKKNDKWPTAHFDNPKSDKPIEEIWDEIDGYTFESVFEGDDKIEDFDFVIPLPPLKYRGKVLKGLFFSQAEIE